MSLGEGFLVFGIYVEALLCIMKGGGFYDIR